MENVALGNKGAAGVNTWADKKGHSLGVIAGTLVHTECRRKYAKPEKSDFSPKADSAKRLTKSSTRGFYFRLNCFLYVRLITETEKQNGMLHIDQCKNNKLIE